MNNDVVIFVSGDMNRSSRVRTVINEEYREAFRTKSYTEICDKFQGRQLETRITIDDATTSSSSAPLSREHVHLSEYLVAEARQETLVSISESSKYHHFLTNYFDISLEASQICEFILQNVHQVRVDYHAIRNVIELVERKPDHKSWSHNQHNCVYKNLASFSLHTNPFSTITPQKLQKLHDTHKHLLHELKSKSAKRKGHSIMRCMKKALAVVGCGALAISLLLLVVVAMGSTVGMAAAPGLIMMSSLVMLVMKRVKKRKQKEGVDAAAKGIYVVIKDFDMMGRLVRNLRDEMEHRKLAAEVCVKKGKNGALREVAREFQEHEYGFLGELEELEKQIYLCFLHINRSRTLLIQQLSHNS